MSKQTATKRKKKKSSAGRPTNSFAEMVGSAQTNALKPFIEQQVQMAVYQGIQSLSRPVLNHVQTVQQTQLAMLRLLKAGEAVTDDSMRETGMDIEDEALGLEVTTEASKEGDLIRIEFRSKLEDQEDFNPIETVQINALAVKNQAGQYQTGNEEVEKALLGSKASETVKLTLPGAAEGDTASLIEMTVLRVSNKKEAVNE